MVGVNEAETIGGRAGMAATVGGSEPGAAAIAAAAVASGTTGCCTGARGPGVCGSAAAVVLIAGVAVGAGVTVISRTTPAARSASRRLRSSETLSVGEVREAFLADGLGFCGLGCTLGGGWLSPSIAWASRRVGWNAKASEAASATEAPAPRQIDNGDG